MGLCAGSYQGKDSRKSGVYVAEDAFFFLEGCVSRHYSPYSKFGHWGVTEIRRNQWLLILQDWALVGETALSAVSPDELMDIIGTSQRLAEEMRRDFARNVRSLAEMLNELAGWRNDSWKLLE